MNRIEFLASKKPEMAKLVASARKPPALAIPYTDISSNILTVDFVKMDTLPANPADANAEDVVKIQDMYNLKINEVRKMKEFFEQAVEWMEIMEELRDHRMDIENEVWKQRT